ncbi:MAG TPA: hypothetical protein VEC18_01540 [Myxococcota bacterium]|nr:hypothetical protein [Myxococcota bacterium]
MPLTGADCFLRAFDREIRRTAAASHVSQLVLRLGPGFDVERFGKLIEQVARAQPILRAPIGRRFALGPPVYRLAAATRCALPTLRVVDADPPRVPDARISELFAKQLNEPLSAARGELLRFDVVRYARGAAGTDFAASWLHMLFDGFGSERFIAWLDACYRGAAGPDELPCAREFAPLPADGRTLRARGDAARAWQSALREMRAHSPHSLAGPRRRGLRQALDYARWRLSPEATARCVARAARCAGALTPTPFYLAAAIRAHHAVFRARGADPGSYVVPLAVNARPKGDASAMFRTHVSLVWFQALRDQVDDLEALVALLKQQRLAAIKQRRIEDAVCAMDFARFAPRWLYARMARSAFHGELCSFFFAFTGEFLEGVERCFGAEILDGFHVAPVPPSPGSCLALSLRAGRLGVTHTHQRGVFSARELEIFREQLERDLQA